MLDRYVLAKTRDVVARVQPALDVPRATAAVPLLDVLDDWYIPRSRTRFWAEGGGVEKRDAFDMLHSVPGHEEKGRPALF